MMLPKVIRQTLKKFNRRTLENGRRIAPTLEQTAEPQEERRRLPPSNVDLYQAAASTVRVSLSTWLIRRRTRSCATVKATSSIRTAMAMKTVNLQLNSLELNKSTKLIWKYCGQ